MDAVKCLLVFDNPNEDLILCAFDALPRRGDRLEAYPEGDAFPGRWVVSRVEWAVQRCSAGVFASQPQIHLTRELGYDR